MAVKEPPVLLAEGKEVKEEEGESRAHKIGFEEESHSGMCREKPRRCQEIAYTIIQCL